MASMIIEVHTRQNHSSKKERNGREDDCILLVDKGLPKNKGRHDCQNRLRLIIYKSMSMIF